MIAGLKPYQQLKDSGVSWLGEIPAHWGVVSSRRVFSARKQLARADDVQLSATQAYGVIPQAEFEAREGRRVVKISMHLEKRRHVERDDFVISMRSFQGGLERARASGCIRSSYVVLKAERAIDVEYFAYLFKSKQYIGALQAMAGFIRDGQDLNYSDFCSVPLPDVPISEQRSIAQFLTYVDRRIRRYVRNKQKQIKLLEEQKQAIIHRAVTRGIDPSVRLKPSGIEWIDMVPAHWRVVALKRVLKRLVDCEHKTAPAVDQSEYRVVRTTAVRDGRIRWAGTYCTTREAFEGWTQRAVPEPDDVIFTREAPAGEACVVPEGVSVCLGQRTVLMKLQREEYDPRFLVHMIYAGPPRHQIQIASQGSTVGHFNMDDIGWMPVLAPPLIEQRSILGQIDRETSHFSATIERTEREIALVRDYRTRLVADVVTGKLDVRDTAASLPQHFEVEEFDEPGAAEGEESDAIELELTEAFE